MSNKQAYDVTTGNVKKKKTKKRNKCSGHGIYNYLLIIVFILFIGVLILVNVNFIDETTATAAEENRLQTLEISSSVETSFHQGQINSRSADCKASDDSCKVSCEVFHDNAVVTSILETHYKICERPLELTFTMTSSVQINKSFLKGNFKLDSLIFDECFNVDFADNFFNKPSLNDLKVLKILKINPDKFTKNTFNGLNALTHFEWTQKSSLTAISSTGFLKPMSSTLNTAIIGHAEQILYNAYRIDNWFSGAEFSQIKFADFKNNKFTDTLSRATFTNLPNLEELILKNCDINYLEADTFDDLLGTLRFLDLSNNQLKKLDDRFIANIVSSPVLIVALHRNEWICSCDQSEFIDAIQKGLIHLANDSEPTCGSPIENKGDAIKSINLCCTSDPCPESETTTTDTTTTTTNGSDIVTDTPPWSSEYPESETTTIADNPPSVCEIDCKISNTDEVTSIFIAKPQTKFKLIPNNSSSIRIEIVNGSIVGLLILLYFTTNDESHAIQEVINVPFVDIYNLQKEETYVFCMLPVSTATISPFDCQSIHMVIKNDDFHDVWISENHKTLFISVLLSCVLLFLLFGSLLMYAVLYWRPVLVKGNPRLFRIDSFSPQVCLYKKGTELFSDYASIYSEFLRSDDYLAYYKKSEILPPYSVDTPTNECLSPEFPAPSKPKTLSSPDWTTLFHLRGDHDKSWPAQRNAHALDAIIEDEDHLYQSLETYEEIKTNLNYN